MSEYVGRQEYARICRNMCEFDEYAGICRNVKEYAGVCRMCRKAGISKNMQESARI